LIATSREAATTRSGAASTRLSSASTGHFQTTATRSGGMASYPQILRNLPLVSWGRKSCLPTSLTMPSGFTGQLSSDSANQLSANAAEAPDCRGHRKGIGRISVPGRDYMSEEPTENLAGIPPSDMPSPGNESAARKSKTRLGSRPHDLRRRCLDGPGA